MKKISAKRIFAIIGIVLGSTLAFVGAVVGVMAAMGKFKKPVVYPTVLSFAVSEQTVIEEIPFKAGEKNATLYSFDLVGTNPDSEHEVNKTQCYIWFNDSASAKLITLCDKNRTPLVANSNNRYLVNCNEPIYYMINAVAENENTNGKVTINARSVNETLKRPENPMVIWVDRKVQGVFVDHPDMPNSPAVLEQEITVGVDIAFDFEYVVHTPLSIHPIKKNDINFKKEIELFYDAGGDYIKVTPEEVQKTTSPLNSILVYEDGVLSFKTSSTAKKEHVFYIAVFKTYKAKTDYFASIEGQVLDTPNYHKVTSIDAEGNRNMAVTELTVNVEQYEISSVGMSGNGASLSLYLENEVYLNNSSKDNNLGIYMTKGEDLNAVEDTSRLDEVNMRGFTSEVLSDKDPIFSSETYGVFKETVTTDMIVEDQEINSINVCYDDVTYEFKIIKEILINGVTYQCVNGAAIYNSKKGIKLIKPGSYLNFYEYDSTNAHYSQSNLAMQISEMGSGADKYWKITPTELPEEETDLRLLLLVVNSSSPYIYASTDQVNISALAMSYNLQTVDTENVKFDSSTKQADLKITFNKTGEIPSELKYGDIIKDIKGTYTANVFAVKKAEDEDEDKDKDKVVTLTDITFNNGTNTYYLVGYEGADGFVNAIKTKANVIDLQIYMIQLKHKFGETVADLINEDVLAEGKAFGVNEIISVKEVLKVNVDYVLNEELLWYSYEEVDDKQDAVVEKSFFENINGTITITPENATMMETIIKAYGYNVVVEKAYSDRVVINFAAIDFGDNYSSITIPFTVGGSLSDPDELISIDFKMGNIIYSLGEIKILDGSPSKIVLKYETISSETNLPETNSIELRNTPGWEDGNTITVKVGYDGEAYTYKFFVNSVEIKDASDLFNYKISSGATTGFQSDVNKDQTYKVEYQSQESSIFDASKITFDKTTGALTIAQGIVLKEGNTVLNVTIGKTTGYINIVTDVSAFINVMDNTNPEIQYKGTAKTLKDIGFKFGLVGCETVSTKEILPSIGNLVYIENLQDVQYGDGDLYLNDTNPKSLKLMKYIDGTNDKEILVIENDETGGWKITYNNPYVPLTVRFDIRTIAGTEEVLLTFTSSITIGVRDCWRDGVFYAGTKVNLNAGSYSVLDITNGSGKSITFKYGATNKLSEANDVDPSAAFEISEDYINSKMYVFVILDKDGENIALNEQNPFSFDVKANVIATIRKEGDPLSNKILTSENSYGVGDIYKIEQYRTKQKTDPTADLVYGSSDSALYTSSNLIDGDTTNLSIAGDSNSTPTLTWDSLENKINIGAITDLNTDKTTLKFVLKYNGKKVQEDVIEIVNKHQVVVDNTKTKEVYKAEVDHEIFISAKSASTPPDYLSLEKITSYGLTITNAGNTFKINNISYKEENKTIIFNFEGGYTYTTTINIEPYTPEERLEEKPADDPDYDVSLLKKVAYSGSEYDLLNDIYDIGDINSVVDKLLIKGIKNEPLYSANYITSDIISGTFAPAGFTIENNNDDLCEVTFKEIVGEKKTVYIEYTISFIGGGEYVYYVELTILNRQTITATYPEGENKEVVDNNDFVLTQGAFEFKSGYESDALYLSGLENAPAIGWYELKNVQYEPVLIHTERPTYLNFKFDEFKKVSRIKVENINGNNNASTDLTIKLIGYQTNVGIKDYVGVNNIIASNNVVTLPSAQNGLTGVLIFKISTASGNYIYYNISIYCDNTKDISASNNIKVNINNVVDYIDLIGDESNNKIRKDAFLDKFKKVYNSNSIKLYLYNIETTGLENNTHLYSELRYTNVNVAGAGFAQNNYFNTITLGVVFDDGSVQKYSIGTITLYVQPKGLGTVSDKIESVIEDYPNGYYRGGVEANATTITCPFVDGDWSIDYDDIVFEKAEDKTAGIIEVDSTANSKINILKRDDETTVFTVKYVKALNENKTIAEILGSDLYKYWYTDNTYATTFASQYKVLGYYVDTTKNIEVYNKHTDTIANLIASDEYKDWFADTSSDENVESYYAEETDKSQEVTVYNKYADTIANLIASEEYKNWFVDTGCTKTVEQNYKNMNHEVNMHNLITVFDSDGTKHIATLNSILFSDEYFIDSAKTIKVVDYYKLVNSSDNSAVDLNEITTIYNQTVAFVTYTYEATILPTQSGNYHEVGGFVDNNTAGEDDDTKKSFDTKVNLTKTYTDADGLTKYTFFGTYKPTYDESLDTNNYTVDLDTGLGDSFDKATHTLTFKQTHEDRIVSITITYDDMEEKPSRTFYFKVKAGVAYEETSGENSGLSESRRYKTTPTGEYSSVNGSSITITREEKISSKLYKYSIGGLVIYTHANSKLVVSFDEDAYVNELPPTKTFDITVTKTINFVHSAVEKPVKMTISIQTADNKVYATRDFYLTVAQTYQTLTPVYLTEGATHENVAYGYKIDNLASTLLGGTKIKLTHIDEYITVVNNSSNPTDTYTDNISNILSNNTYKDYYLGSKKVSNIFEVKDGEIYVKSPSLSAMGFYDASGNPNEIKFTVPDNGNITGGTTLKFAEVTKNTMCDVYLNNDAGIVSNSVIYSYQIMAKHNETAIVDGLDYSVTNGYYGDSNGEETNGKYISFLANNDEYLVDTDGKNGVDTREFIIGKMLDMRNTSILSVGLKNIDSTSYSQTINDENIIKWQYQYTTGKYIYIILNKAEHVVKLQMASDTISSDISFKLSLGGVNGGTTIVLDLTIYLSKDEVEVTTSTTDEYYAGYTFYLFKDDADTDTDLNNGPIIENDGKTSDLTYAFAGATYQIGNNSYDLDNADNDLFKYDNNTITTKGSTTQNVKVVLNLNVTNSNYILTTVSYTFTIVRNMQIVVNGGDISANIGADRPTTNFVMTNGTSNFPLTYTFGKGSDINKTENDPNKNVVGDKYSILVFDLYRIKDPTINAPSLMGRGSVGVREINPDPSNEYYEVKNGGITFYKDFTGEINLELFVECAGNIADYVVYWTINVTGLIDLTYAVEEGPVNNDDKLNSGEKVNIINGTRTEKVGILMKTSNGFEDYIDLGPVTATYEYTINKYDESLETKTNKQLFAFDSSNEQFIASGEGNSTITLNKLELTMPNVPISLGGDDAYYVTYKIYVEYLGLTYVDEPMEDEKQKVKVFYVTYIVVNNLTINAYTYEYGSQDPKTQVYSANINVTNDLIDRTDDNIANATDLILFAYSEKEGNYEVKYTDGKFKLIDMNSTPAAFYEGTLNGDKIEFKDDQDVIKFNYKYKERKLYEVASSGTTESFKATLKSVPSYGNGEDSKRSVFNSQFSNIVAYKTFIDIYYKKPAVTLGDKKFILKSFDEGYGITLTDIQNVYKESTDNGSTWKPIQINKGVTIYKKEGTPEVLISETVSVGTLLFDATYNNWYFDSDCSSSAVSSTIATKFKKEVESSKKLFTNTMVCELALFDGETKTLSVQPFDNQKGFQLTSSNSITSNTIEANKSNLDLIKLSSIVPGGYITLGCEKKISEVFTTTDLKNSYLDEQLKQKVTAYYRENPNDSTKYQKYNGTDWKSVDGDTTITIYRVNFNTQIVGVGNYSSSSNSFASSWFKSNDALVDNNNISYLDDNNYATINIPKDNNDNYNTYYVKKVTVNGTGGDFYDVSEDFFYIDLNDNASLAVPDFSVGTEMDHFRINYNKDGDTEFNLAEAIKVWTMDSGVLKPGTATLATSGAFAVNSVGGKDDYTEKVPTMSTVKTNFLTMSQDDLDDWKTNNPTATTYPVIVATVTLSDNITLEFEIVYTLSKYVKVTVEYDISSDEDLEVNLRGTSNQSEKVTNPSTTNITVHKSGETSQTETILNILSSDYKDWYIDDTCKTKVSDYYKLVNSTKNSISNGKVTVYNKEVDGTLNSLWANYQDWYLDNTYSETNQLKDVYWGVEYQKYVSGVWTDIFKDETVIIYNKREGETISSIWESCEDWYVDTTYTTKLKDVYKFVDNKYYKISDGSEILSDTIVNVYNKIEGSISKIWANAAYQEWYLDNTYSANNKLNDVYKKLTDSDIKYKKLVNGNWSDMTALELEKLITVYNKHTDNIINLMNSTYTDWYINETCETKVSEEYSILQNVFNVKSIVENNYVGYLVRSTNTGYVYLDCDKLNETLSGSVKQVSVLLTVEDNNGKLFQFEVIVKLPEPPAAT